MNATMNKHKPIRKLSTKVLEQNQSQSSYPNKWKEQTIYTNPSGCKPHTNAHNEISFLAHKSKKEYYLKHFDKHESTLKNSYLKRESSIPEMNHPLFQLA